METSDEDRLVELVLNMQLGGDITLVQEIGKYEAIRDGAAHELEKLDNPDHRASRESEQSPREIKRIKGALQTRIRQLDGKISALRTQLALCTSGKERVRAQYRTMCSVPRVKKVTVSEAECSICIETECLFGNYRLRHFSLFRDVRTSVVWHKIGPFSITLNPRQKTVRWINLAGTKNGYHAPAGVGPDGYSGCLGNARTPIQDAFERHDYVTLTEIAVRYAECPGQTEQNILKWPKVALHEVPRWYRDNFPPK